MKLKEEVNFPFQEKKVLYLIKYSIFQYLKHTNRNRCNSLNNADQKLNLIVLL